MNEVCLTRIQWTTIHNLFSHLYVFWMKVNLLNWVTATCWAASANSQKYLISHFISWHPHGYEKTGQVKKERLHRYHVGRKMQCIICPLNWTSSVTVSAVINTLQSDTELNEWLIRMSLRNLVICLLVWIAQFTSFTWENRQKKYNFVFSQVLCFTGLLTQTKKTFSTITKSPSSKIRAEAQICSTMKLAWHTFKNSTHKD